MSSLDIILAELGSIKAILYSVIGLLVFLTGMVIGNLLTKHQCNSLNKDTKDV